MGTVSRQPRPKTSMAVRSGDLFSTWNVLQRELEVRGDARVSGCDATSYDSDHHYGMSNTILLVENVRTGYDPIRPEVNWATAWGGQTRIYFNHEIFQNHSCGVGAVSFLAANGGDQCRPFSRGR